MLQAITNTFIDSSIKKQEFDVDFSVTYKISKSFQVGLNAMNLAGTKLHADAFVHRIRKISLFKINDHSVLGFVTNGNGSILALIYYLLKMIFMMPRSVLTMFRSMMH